MRNFIKDFPVFYYANRLYSKGAIKLHRCLKTFTSKQIHPNYTFTHVTQYSIGNAGDTALSSCVRKLFDLNFGKVSWHLFPMLSTVDDNSIQKFNSSDAVVIGGHGAFLPDTNPNDISGWEFACSEQQYEKIKKPIVVFAVGYNYFKGQQRTELFENNIEKLVEKSVFFGLRNRGSVKEIQSFLRKDLKDKVVYQPCPTMITRCLYKNLPGKKETHKLAFNVALDRASLRMEGKKEMILDQIARSMRDLSNRGYEIHFITHMDGEIDFLQYINRYNFQYKFHSASSWDIERLARFYNKMDVVIGMRGHGIWNPFGVNCQIISLATQEKTKWFLDDINALDWHIDILHDPDTLCSQIVEKFIDIHEKNGEKTTQRLIDEQNKLYRITCENMEKIKYIIGGVVTDNYLLYCICSYVGCLYVTTLGREAAA